MTVIRLRNRLSPWSMRRSSENRSPARIPSAGPSFVLSIPCRATQSSVLPANRSQVTLYTGTIVVDGRSLNIAGWNPEQPAVVFIRLPGQQGRIFRQQLQQTFDVVVMNDAAGFRYRPLKSLTQALFYFFDK